MADSGLMDFLQQLPIFFILMFCGAGVALIVSVTLILNARRQRAQRAMLQTTTAPLMAMPLTAYDSGDMPDLDTLLSSPPPAPPARASSPGVHPVTLSDGGTTDAIELLTVLRDVTGGGLIVQINDKVYRVAGNMSDLEFRTRLKNVMKEVATALGGSAPLPTDIAAPSTPPVPPAPLTSAAFDLPKFSLENSTTPMTRKDLKEAAKAPIPQIDIAGAIEAYLQHKLATSGQFAGRQLHVRPAPDGGIRIQVDSQFFEAVDDITEPDVQAFLKAAIAEWQERQ
jgi:hypothetical protein